MSESIKHPTVTPDDIEKAIASYEFHYSYTLTICVLTMVNGFMVTGESACAHPENYNRELGEKLALAQAKQKMWPLLGYALRDKLHKASESSTFITRLQVEHDELQEKIQKLDRFLMTDAFYKLSQDDHEELLAQRQVMSNYWIILDRRLKRLV